MKQTLMSPLVVLIALATIFAGARPLSAQPITPPTTLPQPERIVAVGGVIGEFGHFVKLLRDALLIDDEARWVGGSTHLVLLGNTVGPGAGLMPTLELVRRLEIEALASGGMVHVLLGSAEQSLLHRDITVVNPVVFETLATEDSQRRIREFTERGVRELIAAFPEAPNPERFREEYERMMELEMRPGGVEFLETFDPGTPMGDWLRAKNVVLRLGDYIFSFGGLSTDYAGRPLEEINAEFRASAASASLLTRKTLDIASPPWWRELATNTELQMQRFVDLALTRQDARALIVGVNASQEAPVRYGMNARVYFADSGARPLQVRGESVRTGSLEIVDDRFSALLDGQSLSIPSPRPLAAAPDKPAGR